MTIVTSRGVLTFDGEVVESFGYSFDKPVVDAVRAASPNPKAGG
jgi:hypothetical protein